MHQPVIRIALVSLLAGGICSNALAQGNPSATVPPNLYEFAGRNISIGYSTSSITGESLLTFTRSTGRQRHFAGDEIIVEETVMGQFVTVALRQISDLKTVSLTVLIPAIVLEDGESTLFETRAFFTSHHTTIAGPDLVDGPLQTYFSPPLTGQASAVDFLASDNSGVIGKVTQSPTCPGPQRPDQRCTGPLPNADVQLVDGSDVVQASAVTDAKGLFFLRAAPGEYTLQVATGDKLPSCQPVQITIPEMFVPAHIRCDTGIR